MTVKELMEILSKLDETKWVTIWNCEYDCKTGIDYVEVDTDGDVVLF